MNSEMIHAIDMAIGLEKEAYGLYLGLMEKAEGKNLKDLFRILAMQEMKHESLLKELRRTGDFRKARSQMQMRYSADAEFDFRPTVSILGLQEGFQTAIKQELLAQKGYIESAQSAGSDDIASLFMEFYEEEKKHEAILREEYRKLFG